MFFRTVIFFLLTTVFISLFADEDFDREQIEQRIKPIGQINLDNSKTPALPAKEQEAKPQATKDEPPGKATYEKYCIICHRDGVAGAPKFRVQADWQPRLSVKLDGLLASALKGKNAMPPKGTCVDCSEEDLKQAIQYMLPQS